MKLGGASLNGGHHRRHFFLLLTMLQGFKCVFGSLESFLNGFFINAIAMHSHVGENANITSCDLNKTFPHSQFRSFGTLSDAKLSALESCHQRCVRRQHTQFSIDSWKNH